MDENQVDDVSRGRLRGFYEWLTGAESADPSRSASAQTGQIAAPRIGHYAIAHKLGEGGMGVVCAARDDLKPSNVFLTPHGVKLLDFGLARPELDRALGPADDLTRPAS